MRSSQFPRNQLIRLDEPNDTRLNTRRFAMKIAQAGGLDVSLFAYATIPEICPAVGAYGTSATRGTVFQPRKASFNLVPCGC